MPVGRKQIVDLRIEPLMAPFNDDRNGFIRKFLFYLPDDLVSRVILILRGKDHFIFRIILDTKALKIAEQIIL